MPRARAGKERGFGGTRPEGSAGFAGVRDGMPETSTQLVVEDLRVVLRIGMTEEERALPRPIRIDLTLEVDYDGSDQLSGTVDLDEVVKAVEALSAGEHRLLETFAHRVAGTILDSSTRIRGVWTAVTKPAPPVGAAVAATGAVVFRSRDG